ncbi:MAG: hypothetical protein M3160_10920 [Candidatus Eremiobacteraeota bacterium]|nr:hypothetical protein [Candidatus Eremiobacteraeota bacterium]MDQ6933666.1 hypothetical protein [Candidatus Eremiobacteraeota bacterium]
MIKNALSGALGIFGAFGILVLIRHATGWPPAFTWGWPAIFFVGFVISIVLGRLLDIFFKPAFTRMPWLERLVSGVLLGCVIFAAVYLHR